MEEVKRLVFEGTNALSDGMRSRLPRWVEQHPDDAEASFCLAELYLRDVIHFPGKQEEAVGLLRRSVESGHVPAMASLGWQLIEGEGVASDRRQGLVLIRRGLAARDPAAFYILGVIKVRGSSLPKDLMGARELLRRAAELGLQRSRAKLAIAYGYLADTTAAVRELNAGIEAGDGDSMAVMALLLASKRPVPDYETGHRLLRRATALNNAYAQSLTGQFYFGGVGVARDDAEAFKWFSLAAESGDAVAYYGLALCYLNGRGVAKDELAGARALTAARQLGHPRAAFDLARARLEGRWGVPKDEEEGRRLMRRAADEGNAIAERYLRGEPVGDPELDLVGEGAADETEADARQAIRVMREMVYRGRRSIPVAVPQQLAAYVAKHSSDGEACFYLSEHYRAFEAQFPGRRAEAMTLLRRAADAGFAPARSTLGLILLSGNGAPTDAAAGLALLRDALLEEDLLARFSMGLVKLEGVPGEPRDPQGAAALFREAVDRGMLRAYLWLGAAHLALGDERAARAAFEAGAAAGEPEAMAKLAGWLLERQTPSDPGGAFGWMRHAAEAGYPVAQRNLGRLYRSGAGTAKDPVKAFEWFKRAAANGDAEAYQWLARAYIAGEGVPKDEAAGVQALKQAAELGEADALFDLGRAYGYGRWGLAQDKAEGLRLIQRAAAKGSKHAQEFLAKNRADDATK